MVSSVAENQHRIAVSARVKDNSGGQAFAFALDQEIEPLALKTKIKLGTLTTDTHMVSLGTFGTDFTEVSGNVTQCVNYNLLQNNVNEAIDPDVMSNLENYNEATPAGVYYVYLYVRDIFNNMVIQPHPSNPIHMKSDTIAIVEFDDFFLAEDKTSINYAEFRSNTEPPQLTQKSDQDMFDFYSTTPRTDKLYANVDIDTKESAVNNVRLVAFSTEYTHDAANGILTDSSNVNGIAEFASATEVYNNPIDNLFNVNAHDAMGEKVLEKVFTGYDDTTAGSDLELAQTYYVYSVMNDKGFNDKPVVRLVKTVTTGTVPSLTSLSASITETI